MGLCYLSCSTSPVRKGPTTTGIGTSTPRPGLNRKKNSGLRRDRAGVVEYIFKLSSSSYWLRFYVDIILSFSNGECFFCVVSKGYVYCVLAERRIGFRSMPSPSLHPVLHRASQFKVILMVC